ncbi:MAG: P-type conjugative transfer protein TrbG [bacterium]|nr:P-type conjugative transfer protein TrbG [bacterium]
MKTKLLPLILLAGISLGCATTDSPPAPLVEATLVVKEPIEMTPPPGTGAHLGGDAQFAEEALEEFIRTGDAPVVRRPGFVLWPFGESNPVLYCKPLRVCDIELQAGEAVNSVMFGDTARWNAELAFTQSGAEAIPHLVVKPREYGIATNLVIMTDRRAYHLALISRKDKKGEYVRNARFYYPREAVAAWNRAVASGGDSGGFFSRLFSGESPKIRDVESLNFQYEITPTGRNAPSWTPVEAFDDGARTFIQFPEAVATGGGARTPVLFVRDEAEREVRNYRVHGDTYVVDGLFETAVLVLGERSVTVKAKKRREPRRVKPGHKRRGGRR